MKNTKLSTKLIGGFVGVAVITLIIGGVGFWGVSKLKGHLHDVSTVRLPGVDNLGTIEKEFESIRVAQRTLLNPGLKDEDVKRQFANMGRAREAYQKAWEVYGSLPKTKEEEALWGQFVPAVEAWKKENDVFFKAANDLVATDIRDPVQLMEELQKFRGDHYKLQTEVIALIDNNKSFEGGHDSAACNFGKWVATFKTSNPELNRHLSEIRPHHNAFHSSVAKIRELMKQGDRERARKVFHEEMDQAMENTFQLFRGMRAEADKSVSLYHQMTEQAMVHTFEKQKVALDVLRKITQTNDNLTKEAVEQANADSRMAMLIVLVGVGIGFALALALGIFLSKSISRSLNRIIEGLNEGADQVASASGQVSSASQSLAEGASEQAAAIEETSSSLEEMSSMTKQNAENANQADNLMKGANQVVNKANESMGELTRSMDEISHASEETSKIIKTIDEIAFQTNLLALNAAVEAARAGEAGAGFAVVAGEVRNLAMRAADAAKNTANLIEGTVKKVKDGSALVTRTNEAFGEVAKSAAKVGELVAEIAAASNEQAQGIDQVNKAVAEMDKVVQQNAANAEESASASEEMNAQAEQMKGMVNELVVLVGGSAATGEPRSTADHKTAVHHFLPAHKAKGKGGAKGRELVLHKGGSGNTVVVKSIPMRSSLSMMTSTSRTSR